MAFPLDCVPLWCVLLPLLATPVASRQLARRIGVAPMPSPKTLTPPRIGLLDGHVRISESDGLGPAVGAGSHTELL